MDLMPFLLFDWDGHAKPVHHVRSLVAVVSCWVGLGSGIRCLLGDLMEGLRCGKLDLKFLKL